MIEYEYCPICGQKKLEKHFIENRERSLCASCKWIDYRNPIPVACALVKAYDSILLVKRKIEPAKGKWALPGGFIELDEDPETAGKRELEEETGLKGTPLKIVSLKKQKSVAYGFVLIVGMEFKIIGGSLSPGDDASEVNYFSRSNLPEIPFKSHQEFVSEYMHWN